MDFSILHYNIWKLCACLVVLVFVICSYFIYFFPGNVLDFVSWLSVLREWRVGFISSDAILRFWLKCTLHPPKFGVASKSVSLAFKTYNLHNRILQRCRCAKVCSFVQNNVFRWVNWKILMDANGKIHWCCSNTWQYKLQVFIVKGSI